MTRFNDGPAQGQTLMLKRTPIFLRVTEEGGKFDALDQPQDRPRKSETLHAYRLDGQPGHCHVNIAGGRGGFYPIANYKLVTVNVPTDEQMRDNAQWAAWADEQGKLGFANIV